MKFTKEYFQKKGAQSFTAKIEKYGLAGAKERQRNAALKGWQKRKTEKTAGR